MKEPCIGIYNLDISLKCSSSIKEKQHKVFLGSNAILFKAISVGNPRNY